MNYKTIISAFLIIMYGMFHSACSESSSADGAATDTGTGGSMARFTVKGDYLYTVDNENLKVFDVNTPSAPSFLSNIPLDIGVETIFPYKDHLFIGSQFGMYIYNIEQGNAPQHISTYLHIYSCDPVVVDDEYAYVTLHSENSGCGRWVDELQIVDIRDLSNPFQVAGYQMVSPRGLGIDGDTLFVCDDGLKVFDVTDVQNIILLEHFSIPDAYDVIPLGRILLVVGSKGLYQYSYDENGVTLISTLSVENEI